MMVIAEVTLGESIQAWIIVIFVVLVFTAGAGALAYAITKPIAEWVLEPFEKKSDE